MVPTMIKDRTIEHEYDQSTLSPRREDPDAASSCKVATYIDRDGYQDSRQS